jgi:integration host factor subunit alpha
MGALTKADIAEYLHEKVGLNRREAKELLETFFGEISQTLIQGTDIKLSCFGNFVLRDKPERPGRNPRTGETCVIAPRRVVTFKPSHALRDCVSVYQGDENE